MHGMKQISIRCNMIEHRVHIRCAGVRQVQYTDTCTCHLHRESGLTMHTNITPSTPPYPGPMPYPLPTCTTHTTATQTQTYAQHFPFSHRIGKAQTQSSYLLTPSPPTALRVKHIHISHTPPTPLIPRSTLIHNTSAALDTIPEPRMPATFPALTTTTPHPSPTQALPSPSHHHTLSVCTHATQTQYTHHSHINHRIHIGYHDTLTDRPKKTTWLQTQYKDTYPAVKVREI